MIIRDEHLSLALTDMILSRVILHVKATNCIDYVFQFHAIFHVTSRQKCMLLVSRHKTYLLKESVFDLAIEKCLYSHQMAHWYKIEIYKVLVYSTDFRYFVNVYTHWGVCKLTTYQSGIYIHVKPVRDVHVF